jgi:hypothetical protein
MTRHGDVLKKVMAVRAAQATETHIIVTDENVPVIQNTIVSAKTTAAKKHADPIAATNHQRTGRRKLSKVNCRGTEEEKPKKVCPEQGHSLPDMDGRRIAQAERTSVEKRACCSRDYMAIRMAIKGASHGRRTIPSGHKVQGRKQSEPASSGF